MKVAQGNFHQESPNNSTIQLRPLIFTQQGYPDLRAPGGGFHFKTATESVNVVCGLVDFLVTDTMVQEWILGNENV